MMNQYFKKNFGFSVAFGLLASLAACSNGGTSIREAPENLLPIVEAVTSSTYSSWDTASTVFAANSSGEKKWSALKMQQKSLFENGDAETYYYWTSDEDNGWNILKFCSEPITENECSSYGKSPEVHVKSSEGKVSELRWFEDAADESGLQPEVLVYQISSSNPSFGAADFSIETAITKTNQSGKSVTCYYGEIEIDSDIASIIDEVYLAVRLDMKARTADGVTLEATTGTSGIIDTSRVDDGIPLVACYEYPALEIERLTIEAGEFRIKVVGTSSRNTSEISILLKAQSL